MLDLHEAAAVLRLPEWVSAMTARHRCDVRGNEIHPPSILPALGLLALAVMFLIGVLVLTDGVAVAQPDPPAPAVICEVT